MAHNVMMVDAETVLCCATELEAMGYAGGIATGLLGGWTKILIKTILPVSVRNLLQRYRQSLTLSPPIGWVRFGSLRQVTPISRNFGFDRGLPIDRYYIERFLSDHELDIQGRILEVGDNFYTRKFCGDRVTRSDVLDFAEGNPKATIVGDLAGAQHIPCDTFDCIICVQTLSFIYDVRAAIQTLHRILKPEGVLLVTFNGIRKIDRYGMDHWGQYWSFTALTAQRLFEEVFPAANVTVKAYGNVLTAIAFLHGLAAEELHQEELDYHDHDYELTVTVRAVKSEMMF